MASTNNEGTRQERNDLREEFKDGQRPTGKDFADLIESSLNQLDDGVIVNRTGLPLNAADEAKIDSDVTCIEFYNPIAVRLAANFDPVTDEKERAILGNGSFYNKDNGPNPTTTHFAHKDLTDDNQFALSQNAVGEVTLNAPTGQSIQITNNGDTQVTVEQGSVTFGDNVNNVGLEVNGDVALRIGGASIADGLVLTSNNGDGTASWEKTAFTDAQTTPDSFVANGDIQIGTSGSPLNLEVNGNMEVGGTVNLGGTLQYAGATDDGQVLTSSGGNGTAVWEDPAWEKGSGIVFTDNNVGINLGATAPTADLEVAGTIQLRPTIGTIATGKVLTSSDANGTLLWENRAFSEDGSTAGQFNSNGNLQVNNNIQIGNRPTGVTGTPSNLEIHGSLRITDGTNIPSQGDYLTVSASGEAIWTNVAPGGSEWDKDVNDNLKYAKGNVGIGDFTASNFPTSPLEVRLKRLTNSNRERKVILGNGAHFIFQGNNLQQAAVFAHNEMTLGNIDPDKNYALAQNDDGEVRLNAPNGKTIEICHDNETQITINNTQNIFQNRIGVGRSISFPTNNKYNDLKMIIDSKTGGPSREPVLQVYGDIEIVTQNTLGIPVIKSVLDFENVSSDRRLKKNIQKLNDGLEKLRQINPVSFMFNGKGGTADGYEQIGVIAQELQQVFPKMVTERMGLLNETDTEKTALLRIDPKPFTFILINAVKELADKVDSLENQLSALLKKEKNPA